MQYIIFQLVFFCALLYFVFKHNKSGVSKLVLIEWTVSSVFTYVYTILVLEGYLTFNFLPVLYWDLCFLIYLFPLLGIKIEDINVSNKFVDVSIKVLTILGILSILPLVENLFHLISNYASQSSAIVEMYEDKMDVDNKANLITWLSPLGMYLHNLVAKFTFPGLVLLFIIATKKEYIPTSRLVVILCLYVNTISFALNNSGRGTVVEFFLITFAFFILFREKIILNIPRTLRLSVLSVVGGIIACMVILTMLRSGGDEADTFDTWAGISLYLGEGQVNFFENMWESKTSTLGDYSFSYVKDLFGFETFQNYLDRRDYWNESRVGYDPVRFYTFIGGWFSDLRHFTILFVIIISFLFLKMLRRSNGVFTPLSLYAIYIYIDIILMGFAFFNFMVYAKFRQAVVAFIYLFVLYHFTKAKKD